MVILINVAYSKLPAINIHGFVFASGDLITGVIYIVRDFAQRAIGQKVIWAMLAASLISYTMSAAAVATASVIAFATAETLDWLIYTFTKKPLSQRLLWSSIISTPVDSLVFLACIHLLNPSDMLAMTLSKWLGVMLVWWLWKARQAHNAAASLALNNSAS
jgi:queuosine precursor transporter